MKKLILILGLATASLFGAVLFGSQKVYAATGEAIDRSTIKVGEQIFFDGDLNDIFRYEEANPTDNCPDTIDGFSNGSDFSPDNTPADATLTVRTSSAGSSNCSEQKETVTFGSSRNNFLKAFVWVDENTISGSDGKVTFIRDGSSQTFVKDVEVRGCSDTITVASSGQALALIERVGPLRSQYEQPKDEHDYDWYPFRLSYTDRQFNDSLGCWDSPIVNGLAISGTPEEGSEGGAPGAGNTGAGAENQPSCESEGGSMSWLLCPALRYTSGAIEALDRQITELLNVREEYYDNDSTKAVWARLRNIAYIILVPIVLIMVISTALGFEFISAYTVKRALPRLVIAAIFIALSYNIASFLITITNDVGRGIQGLIVSAVTNVDQLSLADFFDPDPTSGFLFTAGLATTGVLALGIIPIILLYGLTVALALLTALLLLALRQMLLIALLTLAPLAILAWIFPGNDKLWKLWWGTFSKLLLLFPLIMLLIGSGKVFAYVIDQAPGTNLLQTILILFAYVGPYFFIPATFKFAGGLFATVAGMANDRNRGVFDRLKNARGQRFGQAWQDAKTKQYYKSGPLTRLNSSVQRGTRPTSVLPGRFGAKARSGLSTNVSSQTNQAAKALQDLGLLDDAGGNEFVKHWKNVNGRVRQLRGDAKDARNSGDTQKAERLEGLASSLSQYAQFQGNRNMMLGAAKVNAGFGKLSDEAIESVGESFGNSSSEQAALGAAFGDLVFTSKNAGNYMTYSAKLGADGKVKSFRTQRVEDEGAALQRLATRLKDGGPNVVGNLKPYTDPSYGNDVDVKRETIRALARSAALEGNDGALDQLAAVGAQGSYTDPTTRQAALDFAEEFGIAEGLQRRMQEIRPRDPRGTGEVDAGPPS